MPRAQAEEPNTCVTMSLDIAARLLELQQRVAAFSSLYDEEVTALEEELTRLKVDFVHHYQAQATRGPVAAKAKRTRRAAQRSNAPRPEPEQRPDEPSAQKE